MGQAVVIMLVWIVLLGALVWFLGYRANKMEQRGVKRGNWYKDDVRPRQTDEGA